MAELPVNNPERILRVLDSHLEKDTRIVLFGRAALALGYGDFGSQFGKTLDVDAILPTVEMGKIEADAQFWKAIELTNKHLLPEGLYVSHLFTDEQVALTPNWLEKIVPIAVADLRHLQLFRPSSTDLILTKMMRNDRQDIEDIAFILSREKIDVAELDRAFACVKPHELVELRRIFSEMQPQVRDMAVRSVAVGANPDRFRHNLDPDWWSQLTQQPKVPEPSIDKDHAPEL